MNLCKTLHPDDYQHLQKWVTLFDDTNAAIRSIVHHQHRRWEYAIALEALAQNKKIKTVLEVGAGRSAMPTLLARQGYEVTVIDPDPGMIPIQRSYLNVFQLEADLIHGDITRRPLDQQWDAVICLSTIEHIRGGDEVIKKLADAATYLLIITTDFHQSGQAQFQHHLRTYNESDLLALVPPGWQVLGSPQYVIDDAFIEFGAVAYNFASMVLEPTPKTSKPSTASKGKTTKKATAPKKVTARKKPSTKILDSS